MNQKTKSALVRKWMTDNQGKHKCQCGCGQFIVIKIHHNKRGIPKFVNGHTSRVANPMKGRYGSANPNFGQGTYINSSGYVEVLIPGPGRSHYILEHRLVMEIHLGRKLDRDEVVHHKNGDKQDNRIENLELMANHEHTSKHAREGEVGFGLQRRRGIQEWWKPKANRVSIHDHS